MIGRSKKKTNEPRAPRLDYQRQQSYHYSAKRSKADKLFDRSEAVPEVVKRRFRQLPTIVALALITASALYVASLSSSAQITVTGSQDLLRDRGAVQPKTNEIIASSIMNRTKFTFQDEKVRSSLKAAFPEFADVTITTPIFRHRPHIDIRLSRPTVLLSSGTSIYVLDESGRALFDTVRNKPAFDVAGLPLVQDQSTHQVEIGKTALSSTTVDYITEVLRLSEQKNLKVESLLLTSGGGELDVRYRGISYFVKFNTFEDARKSTGAFIAIKERLESERSAPTEYIDVRLPGRAYVK